MPRKSKTKWEKLQEVVGDLFNGITEKDILVYDKEKMVFRVGDNVIPANEMALIQEQAQQMKSMFLWKILVRDSQYQANLKMFKNSLGGEDILFGKAVLYVIELWSKKLDSFSQLNIPKLKLPLKVASKKVKTMV